MHEEAKQRTNGKESRKLVYADDAASARREDGLIRLRTSSVDMREFVKVQTGESWSKDFGRGGREG